MGFTTLGPAPSMFSRRHVSRPTNDCRFDRGGVAGFDQECGGRDVACDVAVIDDGWDVEGSGRRVDWCWSCWGGDWG